MHNELDNVTLAAWERERDVLAEAASILASADLPVIDDAREIQCLASELRAGFGVQLLWNRETGNTFVTCTLNEETQTFPVPRGSAWEAFEHPFAYGCSLPL